MSKKTLIPVLFIIFIAISFQSCLKDDCNGSQTFVQFTPVYLQVDEIRQDIQFLAPQALENPGKLYFYNNYLFINEIREGIHIIDNSDPVNPTNIAFIKIPGNVDIAVKENILYADNYIDLLAIDIANPINPVFISRTEDVFSSLSQNEELGHLVYYDETTVTQTINCNDPRFGQNWFEQELGGDIFVDATGGAPNTAGGGGGGDLPQGIAGSMARFSIVNCFLYVLEEWEMQVFNIEDKSNPNHVNTVEIGWGIETLFPYGDHLFIGSESGMFIYDNSNPSNPTFVSSFEHARACDPVFIKDNHAFVTLRDGTTCQGFINQMDVVNISDLFNPYLVESYPMDHPHGLSIKGNDLYLCEGAHGLKSFNIENVTSIDQQDHVKNLDAYDVIALPNKDVLMVIGKDGLYQFDSSNPERLVELSVISVR